MRFGAVSAPPTVDVFSEFALLPPWPLRMQMRRKPPRTRERTMPRIRPCIVARSMVMVPPSSMWCSENPVQTVGVEAHHVEQLGGVWTLDDHLAGAHEFNTHTEEADQMGGVLRIVPIAQDEPA